MILHLGSDCFVTSNSILMILDYEEAVKNQDTSLFLKGLQQLYVCKTMKSKSIVITMVNKETKMYVSPISHKTLLKRSQAPQAMDQLVRIEEN